MNILVCGANGFIGRHVVQALHAAGHHVVRGVSRATQPGDVAIDMTRDTQASAWLPRLDNIDAVVNAVGVLRNSARRPMQAVHADAPIALFEACVQRGVRRVIQISALGIEDGTSPYATTKKEADAHLLVQSASGALDGVVLRPSVVFGAGGESSRLFMNLARLPALLLPRPVLRARVQPIHVLELAEVTARLFGPAMQMTGLLVCAGPEPVTLAGFIASLRDQCDRRPASVLPLPDWITRLSAQAGDLFPLSPWGRQALSLLSQDNVGSPDAAAHLLGRMPTHYRHLLTGTTS